MKTTQFICILPIVVLLSSFTACQSAARKVVYSAWEKVGVEKRDLLKDRIEDARDDQKEAGKTFEDVLDRLRAVYKFDGGELGKRYDSLKSCFDDAEDDASKVKQSIKKVETVAGDLFEEWEKEAASIESSALRSKSRAQLTQTKTRYRDLHSALMKAESKMDPVLKAFRDQVLFMKHNLNAQAIASLKGESLVIENDIKQLIERMQKSITEADRFIAELPN